jgi:peroxiredoxin
MLGAGDSAPDFDLKTVQGVTKRLSDLISTKPALITFFKVGCPVCQMTLPFIERLSKSDNLEFVAISQDDSNSTEEFRKRFGVTFQTLLDESGKGYPASNAFGITHVPSMFLVEPDNNISIAVSGFSKRDLEAVGKLAGVEAFKPGERVPDFKGG